MMMTGRAFSTATKSTPAGLLTEAEVWCKISDLAARIKETGEKTSVLFSALRGGLAGSNPTSLVANGTIQDCVSSAE